MSRRSSTDTIGPWALLITRSARYRWRSRRAATSSSRKASGSGWSGVVRGSVGLVDMGAYVRRLRRSSP